MLADPSGRQGYRGPRRRPEPVEAPTATVARRYGPGRFHRPHPPEPPEPPEPLESQEPEEEEPVDAGDEDGGGKLACRMRAPWEQKRVYGYGYRWVCQCPNQEHWYCSMPTGWGPPKAGRTKRGNKFVKDLWPSDCRCACPDSCGGTVNMRRREWRGDSDELVSEVERQKEVKGRCIDDPVCGPDITSHLSGVVRLIRHTWKEHWDDDKRIDGCVELLTHPVDAWDIKELHTTPEVLEQPGCWIPDRCRMTVQVWEGCHSIDATNYVAFGVMWSLCHDHFENYQHMPGDNPYNYTAMVVLVGGWGLLARTVGHTVERIMRYRGPRGGAIHRLKWAIVEWNGWPGAPTPPGDVHGCAPICGPYKGPPFEFTWEPHHSA